MIKKIALYLFISSLIIGCEQKVTTSIEGDVINNKSSLLFVEKKNGLFYDVVDTIIIKDNGKFDFELINNQPAYYRLNFNFQTKVNLMVYKNDLILSIDASKYNKNYTVEGSPDHRVLNEVSLILDSFESTTQIKRLRIKQADAIKKRNKIMLAQINNDYEKAVIIRDEMIKEVLNEGLNNDAFLGVMEVLYSEKLNPPRNLKYYRKVSDHLKNRLGESNLVKDFNVFVNDLEKNFK